MRMRRCCSTVPSCQKYPSSGPTTGGSPSQSATSEPWITSTPTVIPATQPLIFLNTGPALLLLEFYFQICQITLLGLQLPAIFFTRIVMFPGVTGCPSVRLIFTPECSPPPARTPRSTWRCSTTVSPLARRRQGGTMTGCLRSLIT